MEQKELNLTELKPCIDILNLLEDLTKLEQILAQERAVLKKVETTRINQITEQKKDIFSEVISHKATLDKLQLALKNNEDIQGMDRDKILIIKINY